MGYYQIDRLFTFLSTKRPSIRQLVKRVVKANPEESDESFSANCKDDPMWDPRALSFPRNGYSHTVQATARTAEGRAMQEHAAALPGRTSAGRSRHPASGDTSASMHVVIGRTPETAQQPAAASRVDAITSASLYAKHDIPPSLANLTAQEQQGEALFQQNCAFCHAADGTGRNWIGSFLQPPPRNLTSAIAMQGMTRARLKKVIRDGLPGTTMPAWKSVLNDSQMNSVITYVSRAFHPLPE